MISDLCLEGSAYKYTRSACLQFTAADGMMELAPHRRLLQSRNRLKGIKNCSHSHEGQAQEPAKSRWS